MVWGGGGVQQLVSSDPDVYRLLLKEEGMLHSGKHGPVPTFKGFYMLYCDENIGFSELQIIAFYIHFILHGVPVVSGSLSWFCCSV